MYWKVMMRYLELYVSLIGEKSNEEKKQSGVRDGDTQKGTYCRNDFLPAQRTSNRTRV